MTARDQELFLPGTIVRVLETEQLGKVRAVSREYVVVDVDNITTAYRPSELIPLTKDG